MADVLGGLAAALADRYRIELTPEGQPWLLGQGGMATSATNEIDRCASKPHFST